MKITTYFKSLLMMVLLCLGMTNAWGQETVTSNFGATYGDIDDNISFTTQKNEAQTAPAWNTNSNQLRLYYDSSGNGGSVTLHPAEGIVITDVILTSSTSPTVKYNIDEGSDETASGSGETYTISNIEATESLRIRNANTSNTQLRLTGITVTYTTATSCEDSNLTFANATVTTDIAEGNTFTQTATSDNATTAIAYESSNEAVATVDANTGEVTLVSVGTTIITANQEAGTHNATDYCADTATYELTVISTEPVLTVSTNSVSFTGFSGGAATTEDITINGANLTGNIALSLTGDTNFSINPTSLSSTGGEVTITYTPSASPATHSATLTVSNGSLSEVITLSGVTNEVPVGPCFEGHAPSFPTKSGYTTGGETDSGVDPTTTIRLASSSNGGSVSTTATGVIAGDITVRFRAKSWSGTETQVTVQVGSSSVLYTDLTTSFAWHEVTFSDVLANPTLTFSTVNGKRLHLGNVEIFCNPSIQTPTLTASETEITGLGYMEGNASVSQSFSLSGMDLEPTSGNITVTAPANFQVSTDDISFSNSLNIAYTGGALASTDVYVRLNESLAINTYNGNITISGGGASDATVSVEGMVTAFSTECGFEDFNSANLTSSYVDGSFVGNDGITWTYVASRNENADENNSGIDGNAIMLRRASDNSAISSSTISNGIGNFSVKLYKGFTGGSDRQVELFVNGISQGTSTPFNDFDEHIFTVEDIDIEGNITIEIRNITANQIIIDDITWTCYQVPCTTPAPSADAEQAFCPGATVADLEAIGNDIKWYDSETATEPLLSTQGLTHNVTYYVSQTIDDCESERIAVTVSVQDDVPPTPEAENLAPILAQCEVNEGDLTPPTATDNCSGTVTVTHNAIFPITASTIITWTFADETGNIFTQEQEVIIQDTTAPVPNEIELEDIVEQCELLESQVTPPTATDNCGGTVTVAHDATFPITETTTITWTFTDESDNWTTQEQVVTIQDTTAPVPNEIELEDIVEQCELLESQVTPPTATDNCSGTVTVTHNATFPITETTTITWTFTDESDNWTTQEQVVTIQDTIAPVPNKIELEEINRQCEVLESDITVPTATDNCGGTVTVAHDATFPITETTTITWTFTDESDNWTTQEQVVTIQDTTDPTPEVENLAPILAQCEVNEGDLTPPTATDNCGGTVTVTHNATFPITETTTITWTFTDESDNWTTQEQVVTIQDTTDPTPEVENLAPILAQCEVNEGDLTPPTATDNCGGTVTVTHNAIFPITETTTITWTFTDESDNWTTQEQVVTIQDTTDPTPEVENLAPILAQCEVNEGDLTPPTATDNCGGTVTVTHNAIFPITETTTITWTYEDETGNSTTQEQVVTIQDTTAPVPDTAELAEIIRQCELRENELTAPTATDNCSGTVTVTHNAIFPITETTIITWTYEDQAGNTTTQEQEVIIQDTIAPEPDDDELEDIVEQCQVIESQVTAPTATDNCDGEIIGTTDITFPITETTTITWTFTDETGNSITQVQEVIIEDTIAPVPNTEELPGITMQCEVLESDIIVPTANDNCDGEIIGTTDITFPITETTTITWTYEDEAGNETTQEQLVTVLPSVIENVILNDVSTTYDGNLYQIEVENLPDGATVTYSIDPTTENDNGATEAGIYEITAVVNPPSTAINCDDVVLTATLTIEKAILDITLEDATFLRDCTAHSLIISGDLPSGVNVTYTGNEQTETGVHTVTANIDGGNNYEDLTLTATMTIQEVQPEITNYHSCGDFLTQDVTIDLPSGWEARWYDSASSTTPITTIQNSGIYYVSAIKNNCESERVEVAVTVVHVQIPSGNTDQIFCGSATVTDLIVNHSSGSTLNVYDSEFGGTALSSGSSLNSGIYYISEQIDNCESERLAVNVTVIAISTPTTNVEHEFCDSATIEDLLINHTAGSTLLVYESLTQENPLAPGSALYTGTFYVSEKIGICESDRLAVQVSVVQTPDSLAPQTITICGFEVLQNITLGELPIADLVWYANETTLQPMNANSQVYSGTLYASQKVGICESPRTAITFEVNEVVPQPTANSQSFCESAVVSNLIVTGVEGAIFRWFDSTTSTTPLANDEPLSNGTYYVSQELNGCESSRKAISVQVINIAAPQIANMSLCSGMTIAEVEIPATTGITHKWYISPVAITALSPNTLLANNTYYISKVYNGCESERVAVDVEIVPVPNAPTGESEQSFVYNFSINEVTIADLLVNEENVLWFAHPDDAATLINPLQSNMPLANNTTYYAVIVNDYGCVSDYLAVTVTVVLGEKRFDRAKLHYYPNPTQGILYIEYANIIENVEVYNAVGQLVKSQDFDSNKVTLDINELSNGTYLLKLSINGQQQLIKVMKK